LFHRRDSYQQHIKAKHGLDDAMKGTFRHSDLDPVGNT
jgi:hypothetical protein